MASTAPSTSRRQMLTAAMAIPACALVARSSPAIPRTIPADRTAWERAFAAMRRAEVASAADAFNYDRTYAAWEAARPSMDAIHWREFPFVDRDHTARLMDLDKAWTNYLAGEGKWWFAKDADAAKAKHRAALDSIRDFRRCEAENDARFGINEAVEGSNDLDSQLHDTQWALLVMPAPDADALMWKLNYLFGDDGEDGFCGSYRMDAITAIIADTSRLLAAGRG